MPHRAGRSASLAALLLALPFAAGSAAAQADTTESAGEGVWRNYDFVPGRTVWLATDFTNEPVGRFPGSQLKFVRGNMQLVERNGTKVLEVAGPSEFQLVLSDALPPDFTLEWHEKIGATNMITNVFFSAIETSLSRYPDHYVSVYHSPGIFQHGNPVSNVRVGQPMVDNMMPIKFQVDGEYAIMYVGGDRVAQVPTVTLARGNTITFRIAGNPRLPTYLSDIVVAVGLDKLYDALMKDGSWTTRGILFDVDSDRLRPESTPVLKELQTTLTTHADLKLTIEGHTDHTGEDAHNLDLSQRRARAVVAWLTQQGIAADRLEAEGKGETEPVADNATPEGRQQNRRVVVRKQ